MYTWIAETFGFSDGLARGIAFALALGIVLVLITLFVFILKRLTETRLSRGRGRQPRIAVMDATSIDTRRRLLLIRRDNVEHLILVGGPSDIVVEQGIIKNTPLAVGPPKHQTAPASLTPSAPGYDVTSGAAEPNLSELEQFAEQTVPRPTPPKAPAPPQPRAKPEGHSEKSAAHDTAAAPARPVQSRRAPVEHASASKPADLERKNGGPKLNPAKSILEAAAARRISSAFTARKTEVTAPATPHAPANITKPAPVVNVQPKSGGAGQSHHADSPVPAQRPAYAAPVSNKAAQGPGNANSEVADYARDLASAAGQNTPRPPNAPLTPNAPFTNGPTPDVQNVPGGQSPEPGPPPRHEVRPEQRPESGTEIRQMSPPSSGPAAKARTAFMKQPLKQDAAVPVELPANQSHASGNETSPASVVLQGSAPTNVAVLNPNPVTHGTTPDTQPSVQAISLTSVTAEPPMEADIFEDAPSKAAEVNIQSNSNASNIGPAENSPLESLAARTATTHSTEDMPNPIEDEMTKLLGEINGPQKQ